MKTFLIVMFVLHLVGAGINLREINLDHPRTIEYSFLDDLMRFVIGSGFAIWAGFLLF